MKKISTAEITPYVRNPRTNTDSVAGIAASIKEFGFLQPIVLDKNNVIVAGHTRFAAALKLELEEVPVVYADNLTDQQIKAYRILDNKLAEKSAWDFDLLDLELKDLPDFNFEPFDVDFQIPEKSEDQKEIIEDEIPEDVEPICQYGELWQLGDHQLLCGDSTKPEDVARLMDGKKADMVFTDPPYGVSYASKNKFLNLQDKGNRIQDEIENDHMSLEDMQNFIYLAFCRIKESLKKRSSYYITAPQGGELMMMMMMMMQKAGIPLRHCLIWVKNNHVFGRCDYNYKHEPILYGWIDVHDYYGEGEHRFSTWEIPKPSKNDLHPTMKPVSLVGNACLNSTKKDDLVLDPFLGSGTTLVACEQLNRKCYGMEISPKYCDVIIKRWENLTGLTAIKCK